MVYNLTEKLKFDEDPIMQIKDVQLTVRSDAEIVLQLLDVMQGRGELAGAMEALKLLLSPADQEKLAGLHLKTADYVKVTKVAVDLALGEDPDDEDQGE